MAKKGLGAVAGVGAAAFIGFAAAALQGARHPDWLWGLALAGLLLAILAGTGWLLTREDRPRAPIRARADRGSTALAAGRDLFLQSSTDSRDIATNAAGIGQHQQDLAAYVATLRVKPYPTFLDDFEYGPKDKLLHQSLRMHFPEMARVEGEIGVLNGDQRKVMGELESRATSEAVKAGLGEGGKLLLVSEARHAARSSVLHFDDRFSLELRDDGHVWLGAFDLGAWCVDDMRHDQAVVREKLTRLLQDIHTRDEAVSARRIVDALEVLLPQYDDALAKISVTYSLPGACEICP